LPPVNGFTEKPKLTPINKTRNFFLPSVPFWLRLSRIYSTMRGILEESTELTILVGQPFRVAYNFSKAFALPYKSSWGFKGAKPLCNERFFISLFLIRLQR